MKELIARLNKQFENRIRLGIMSALSVNASVDFNSLKDLLDVTDGNLASHLNALEKNGLVAATKRFIGKKPNTTYSITDAGKTAFKEHLETLSKLIGNQ